LKLKRLTKAQKVELFKTIRFSFMSHEDLLALTVNPTFDLAKAFIIEGLSVRLNPYENAIKGNNTINLEPRANYDPALCNHASVPGSAEAVAAAKAKTGASPSKLAQVGQTY